jgi:hypothetical protein
MQLLYDLTFAAPAIAIKVRNMAICQVLKEDDDDARVFLLHVEITQRTAISAWETFLGSACNIL